MDNKEYYIKLAKRAESWIKAINEELRFEKNLSKQYIVYLTKLKLEYISDIQKAKNYLQYF